MKVTSEMINEYLETALWSSHDPEDSEKLPIAYEEIYTVDNFAEETLELVRQDIETFFNLAGEKLIEQALEFQPMDHIMHDFWLTRNGHGCGFWDGDYSSDHSEGKVGKKLTDICKTFRELNIYVGDDNRLYLY